jgi:(p)ppGpp synthase/HD superfamily hydrolase
MNREFSMWNAMEMACNAHQGQVDKIGKPYIGHVITVARGVSTFGEQAIIAGLLHDIVEDTGTTFVDLHRAGCRADTLASIRLLTKRKGQPLREYLTALAQDRTATLVKIADNAHNTLPERMVAIQDEATRERLAKKYAQGREILWNAVSKSDVQQILRVVNPSLEDLLEAM